MRNQGGLCVVTRLFGAEPFGRLRVSVRPGVAGIPRDPHPRTISDVRPRTNSVVRCASAHRAGVLARFLGGGAREARAPPGRGARERSLGGGAEHPRNRAGGPPKNLKTHDAHDV